MTTESSSDELSPKDSPQETFTGAPEKDISLNPAKEHVVKILIGDLPKLRDKLLAGDKEAIDKCTRDAGNNLAEGPLGVDGCVAVRAIIGIAAGLEDSERSLLLAPDVKKWNPADPTSRDRTMHETLEALRDGVLNYEGTQAVRGVLASVVASRSLPETLNVLLSDRADLQLAILAKDQNKLKRELGWANAYLADSPLGETQSKAVRALTAVAFDTRGYNSPTSNTNS